MKIVFIGDIHLGFYRKSFTHPVASERYQNKMVEMAEKALHLAKQQDHYIQVIQVGDLYHHYSNKDIQLGQGLSLSQNIDYTLSGNHDISHDLSKETTLGILSEAWGGEEASGVITKITTREIFNTSVTFVPYYKTQKQFLGALIEAEEVTFSGIKILVLHTNFNLSYDITDTTNNLTRARAVELLETFDFIVSGHEHNYGTYLDGRLIMTGSVFPLSMSELESKYVHIYDTDMKEFSKVKVWENNTTYTYDIDNMPEYLKEGTQFVSVVGKQQGTNKSDMSKKILSWWKTCQTLLVCKPDIDTDSTNTVEESSSGTMEEMVHVIRQAVQKQDLYVFNLVADQAQKQLQEGQV